MINMARWPRSLMFVSAVMIFLSSGSLVHAQDAGFAWQAFADRNSAGLTYGVPETDNTQFFAECGPNAGPGRVSAVFGYNGVAGLRNGQTVLLQYFTNKGDGRLSGRVEGVGNTEERIAGVRIVTGVADPVWTAIAAARSFDYRIAGRAMARMGLRGSGAAMSKFIGGCQRVYGNGAADRNAGGGSVQQTSTDGVGTDPQSVSCAAQSVVKSRNSQQPVSIRFNNRTQETRGVLWIDYKGQPIDYKQLNPGESYTQKTFVDHPWMLTDGPGNCIEMFIPKPGARTFNITRKSPGFGPE